MLSNKKINIIVNKKNIEHEILYDILKKNNAKVLITELSEDIEDIPMCCSKEHNCDCIVFDIKNIEHVYSCIKLQCFDFASIIYLRYKNVSDDIIEWKIYKRFDSILNEIPSALIENYKKNNEVKNLLFDVYEKEVISTIINSINIHKRRKDDYYKILNTFLKDFSQKSEYIARIVISESCKIIAIDDTFKRILGKDVTNANVSCVFNDLVNIKRYFGKNIGDIIEINGKKLRLLNVFELINGEKYFLEIWELYDETEKIRKAINRLEIINHKLESLIKSI